MLEDKLVKQEPRVEIVPLQVLLDEEDEEWRQMIEDVESGKNNPQRATRKKLRALVRRMGSNMAGEITRDIKGDEVKS